VSRSAQPVDKRLLARSSPAGLAWWASGGDEGNSMWLLAPHLNILSQKIIDVATGRIPRLIVTMPPRHGKSELISRFTPAWFLGNFPDKKVMLTSYADTFAAQWGRAARDVLKEYGPELFGVTVDAETSGGQLWQVQGRRGIMVTAGVGGGLTGKGGDLLIIDDPVKNSQEAQSETTRQAHHEWWKSTARTRLQKDAGVILVMTRWHEDDLVGRLLGDAHEGGDKWEVLNLPGIAEKDDLLGREEGEALWPEMFPLESLEQTRRAMGTYWFTAMYQQRPAPAEGMLFKKANFRYYTKSEDNKFATIYREDGAEVFDSAYGLKFCTMDVAASEKTEADYTVIATWIVTPNRDLLLWDRERVKFQGPDLKPLVKRVYYEQQPAFIGIERLGYGYTLIQELLREGLPIIKLEPDTDKISRALPACARYEEHRIFHQRGPSWVQEEWEDELLKFPNATHDDQVDTVAYAAMQLPQLAVGTFKHNRDRAGLHTPRGSGKTITGGLLTQNL